MKYILSIFLLCLLTISVGFAETPKAKLNIIPQSKHSVWPAQFQLILEIPKDHHAYLDSGDENVYIPIAIDPHNQLHPFGLNIQKLEKPAGNYDNLVKAKVLRDRGEFMLWLNADNPDTITQSVPLELTYQLCNDLTHVCFRPQTAKQELQFSSVTKDNIAATTASKDMDLMGSLLALFKNHQHNTLLIFGLMFLAGILSVATPCVYPMLPITSMFILNRANGDPLKEKEHAFVYLIGIVGTYTVLGLVAGMTGGAFNTFMQSAAVNLVFAVFFSFFALALLGFYELGILQNEVHSLDQHSARVKGLTGTWLMGSVAGLVISPCVGPIVFALLLQVADNIAAKSDHLAKIGLQMTFLTKFSIAAQGSLMMAGFGLGVGLPFFMVSAVKFKKLPRAGYWMNKIKYAFGIVILYFAFSYLEKGMGILGVNHSTTANLALGVVIVWIAVIHCEVFTLLPTEALPNQKLLHFTGVITLIIGTWLLVVSLGQLPLAGLNTSNTLGLSNATANDKLTTPAINSIEREAGIDWYRNFETAKKVALETHKPIFVDFFASWCSNCVAFKNETANNIALNQVLREKVVALKLVDKEADFEAFRENPEHRQLKIGLPYFAIFTATGQLFWSGTDYTATQQMIEAIEKAAQ